MMKPHDVVIAAAVALSSVVPLAAAECPPAVTAAVQKAHAAAVIASCKKEHEHGQTQFSVQLAAKGDESTELEVSPDGTILMTEQSIAVGEVPSGVMKAFAATYEIEFKAGTKQKEAIFGSDGTFVEEE